MYRFIFLYIFFLEKFLVKIIILINSNKMSLPYVSKTQKGSTINAIVLGSNASTLDNFYNNYSITLSGITSTISSYTATTFTAVLTSNLASAPIENVPFIISDNSTSVILTGLIGTGSTVLNVILDSQATGLYTGNYITISSDTVLISTYDSIQKNATLSSALSVAPISGTAYAICKNNPSWFLFGIDTSIVGGNTNFEITIVLCIVIICISSIVLLLFVIPSVKKSGGNGGSGGNMDSGHGRGPVQPITLSLNTSPIYYPPQYR